MTKTDAERKAAERQRKQEQGLKRREFWLTDEQHQMVAAYLRERDNLIERFEHIRKNGTIEELERIDGFIDGFDHAVKMLTGN